VVWLLKASNGGILADKLTHLERIERLLSGVEIDRPPVTAWRHFYEREQTPDGLAEAMLSFQAKYDWDLMKINPRASYYVEGWGVRFRYSGTPGEKPASIATVVKTSDDLLRIKPLDPHSGSYGEQLKAVGMIKGALAGRLDFVQTVFSPLSVAADLAESNGVFIDLMNAETNLEPALDAITITLERYVEALLKAGASGIFFATTEWATRDHISEEQYLEYGQPYDLRVMEKAKPAKFNVLHVCKRNNLLPLFKRYPVDILSWDKYEPGNFDFAQADKIFTQVFMGGIDHLRTLVDGTSDAVAAQVVEALADVGNHPLILAPGCALRINTRDENLQAMRKSVGNTERHWAGV